jgi:hypothetical protein
VGDPSLEVTMERFDAHAARWRLQAYRLAAASLLDGLGERRTVRALVRDVNVPLAEAEGVVARVLAEVHLRRGAEV